MTEKTANIRMFSIAVCSLVIAFGSIGAMAASSGLGFQIQERKPRKVTRVKRPRFTKRDWDGIYFEDLFRDGLVGERPRVTPATDVDVVEAGTEPATDVAPTDANGMVWSQIVSSDAIEDEVKAIQQKLMRDITTPGKFKTGYAKVRQSYAELSMMFAIIREYDADVRWKRDSVNAQAAFARSAAASRVGTSQAYENVKRRRDELTEMVRGGNFESTEKGSENLEWVDVIDRSPLMIRLQSSIDIMKPAFANKTEFNKLYDEVLHESNLVAAMGRVLVSDGMEEWEEDEYTTHSKLMTAAARQIVEASNSQNFEKAATAFNAMSQSCSNCHDEWR